MSSVISLEDTGVGRELKETLEKNAILLPGDFIYYLCNNYKTFSQEAAAAVAAEEKKHKKMAIYNSRKLEAV